MSKSLNLIIWIVFLVLVLPVLLKIFQQPLPAKPIKIAYSEFLDNVRDKKIQKVKVGEYDIKGEINKAGKMFPFITYIPYQDKDLINFLKENRVVFEGDRPPGSTWWMTLLWYIGTPVIFIFLLWLLMYKQTRGGPFGRGFASFGQSRHKFTPKDKPEFTFVDVAGVEEAKEELQEVIDFLKDPKKFQKLGAKIPKGVLLVGRPGTGKTLLAKAVAGEAEVPFMSISGSDFVEMFVGVGASRVRDMFNQAKKHVVSSGKGCIIFIDEIDAVGRQRGAGFGGGHDEREQTLNQLLVEMDGFATSEGVILIAATNRPDVLDPALLRPGRFDRHIVVTPPDIIGREAILKVHLKNKPLDKEVDLKVLAKRTTNFVGSELANMANEAALLGARREKETIGMKEFEDAIERIIAGPEKKSSAMSDKEKRIVAYHEAGHTLVAKLIPVGDSVHKVSIIQRGLSAGYTLLLPENDKSLHTSSELLDRMACCLGGREAELMVFNDITEGSSNDIELVTNLAHEMVCKYGMSEELGPITFGKSDQEIFLGRDFLKEKNYSEETSMKIDREVRKIVDICIEKAKKILFENHDKLDLLANTLIEKEVLDAQEIDRIISASE